MTIDGYLNIIQLIREKTITGLTDLFARYAQKSVGKILKLIHPNYLTVSRATVFPCLTALSLIKGNEIAALTYWILGWFTDPLDGPWAIVTNQQTEWGKILDPVCDRIFFLSVIIVTILTNDLIWPLRASLWLALSLELLLPALYLIAKLLKQPIALAHNKYGKATTIITAAALPLIWFSEHSENWQFILGGIISAAILTSLINIGKHIKTHLTLYKRES